MGWSIGYSHIMKFYTYIWLREDGTPYYVGKGCGDRATKRRWRRIGFPPPVDRIVITYHESEEAAFNSEKSLIALYGRKDLGTGCLSNMTDGGENPPSHLGKKRSPEWIQKQRAKKIGRKTYEQSAETCHKRRLAMLGRTFSAESIEKMRAAQLGKTHSLETRAKMSLINRGRNLGVPWSPARRLAEERRKSCLGL